MNDNLRKHYDDIIKKAFYTLLDPDKFSDWKYENYRVSSSVHPSGIFSNDREYIEYDNRMSWEEYCDNNNIDPESQQCQDW
jgi:hypothetical protein